MNLYESELKLGQTVVCKVLTHTKGSVWVRGEVRKIINTKELYWDDSCHWYSRKENTVYTVKYDDPDATYHTDKYDEFKRNELFTTKEWAKYIKTYVKESVEILNKKNILD